MEFSLFGFALDPRFRSKEGGAFGVWLGGILSQYFIGHLFHFEFTTKNGFGIDWDLFYLHGVFRTIMFRKDVRREYLRLMVEEAEKDALRQAAPEVHANDV